MTHNQKLLQARLHDDDSMKQALLDEIGEWLQCDDATLKENGLHRANLEMQQDNLYIELGHKQP